MMTLFIIITLFLILSVYSIIQRLVPALCKKCGKKKGKYKTFNIKGSPRGGAYFRCENCLNIFNNRR